MLNWIAILSQVRSELPAPMLPLHLLVQIAAVGLGDQERRMLGRRHVGVAVRPAIVVGDVEGASGGVVRHGVDVAAAEDAMLGHLQCQCAAVTLSSEPTDLKKACASFFGGESNVRRRGSSQLPFWS